VDVVKAEEVLSGLVIVLFALVHDGKIQLCQSFLYIKKYLER